MSQAAEAIAKVIDDLNSGRGQTLHRPELDSDKRMVTLADAAAKVVGTGVVVDCTTIYESLVAKDEPIYLYEDHPSIAPPWTTARFCYQNEHGNVIVMSMVAIEIAEEDRTGSMVPEIIRVKQEAGWIPANPIDWSLVRWELVTFVWVGGTSPTLGGKFPTLGPVHLWQFAVYEDGTPADLHWLQMVVDYPAEKWDMAHLVLLGALNFLNCRNVDIVEPSRPRATRRRMQRESPGVVVHTINVFPASHSARSGSDATGTPLHSVRGHFAKYGPEYDRGLLFGKYAGRFFIPQHARGTVEHGQVEADYKLFSSAGR